jgi:exopolysaccharide biosynthesis protein
VIRSVAACAVVLVITADAPRQSNELSVRWVRDWTPSASGVEWSELSFVAGGERFRLVLVRLDPSRVQFLLAAATRDAGLRGAWTIDSAPPDAVVAVNAGQFAGGTPWGWVVRDGVEIEPPGVGPLATAVIIDRSGAVRFVRADSVRSQRDVMNAFESYPTLLWGEGEVPQALRAPGRGVDLAHRDSRVAIGLLRDGRVLVGLTRFLTDDGRISTLPFGPTIPEMATLMARLGCRRAVALDGGISSQLAIGSRRWPGYRRVPLALIATAATAVGGASAPRTR